MTQDLPNAVITVTDLYRSLENLNLTMGGIATDLKVMNNEVTGHSGDIKDHEARIRLLERSRSTLFGAIVVISAIFSALSAYFVSIAVR